MNESEVFKKCLYEFSYIISAGVPSRARTGLRRAAHASLKAHSAHMACQQLPLHEEPEPSENPDDFAHFEQCTDNEQNSIGREFAPHPQT